MELCSSGHDEVCYEGGYRSTCPVCAAIAEKDDEITDLKKEIESLKEDEDEMAKEFAKYENFYNELKDQYPEYEI